MGDERAYLVLTNEAAGSSDEERLDAALAPLRAAPVDVEVVATADAGDVSQAVAATGGRTLVVAGGDGSLHVAVQALWDLGVHDEVVLGLLPLGTGNDFARTAGIPLDPEEAGRALLDADPRPTDLVVDDAGTVVVNASHAGMSASASARAGDLKPRLGPVAYPVAAFLEGIGTVGFRGTVIADGTTLADDEELLLVGVGNGQSIGGGTPLFPDATLDDGWLEVLVTRATGPLARVGFAAGLRSGEHVDRDDVITARAHEVTIRGDAVPHCPDGEVSDPVAERTYRVVPDPLRVLRPG